MKCRETREFVHEFVDGELSGFEENRIEQHLQSCSRCRRYVDEMRFVQEALSVRAPLPRASSHLLWNNVRQRTAFTWQQRIGLALERLTDRFRDMESRVLWARLGAVPLSLAFFALLIAQMGQFSSSLFPMLRGNAPGHTEVVFTPGRLPQDRAALFVKTVEKLDGEDHAAVVAHVRQDGRVEIEGVAEYPENLRLLDALEESVRATRFASSPGRGRTFVHVHSSIEVVEPAERGM
ncbi:MAG TPA: zf-HC2 domain-containing protein [Acidobacteriota bacterium]|nr:zf-HC2 domain-containing protein [Acidobacteriota bacterium]